MEKENAQSVPEILVLAAGRATRFGADKRQQKIAEEQMLIERTIEQLGSTALPLTVCLASRESDDALAAVLEFRGVTVLRCERAEEGMGSTLAEAVTARSAAPALLVALGDMPLVSGQTVAALCRAWRGDAIVIPLTHEGGRGHPVLFDRRYFAELCQLSGDRGAAPLLRRYAAHCVEVLVDDPGIHLDADTPEALEALRAQLASRSSRGVSG